MLVLLRLSQAGLAGGELPSNAPTRDASVLPPQVVVRSSTREGGGRLRGQLQTDTSIVAVAGGCHSRRSTHVDERSAQGQVLESSDEGSSRVVTERAGQDWHSPLLR